MKSLIFSSFIFLTLFLNNSINSQITIDGFVTDGDHNSIENALVEIFDNNDTSKVFSGLTDGSGYFSISTITGLNPARTDLPNGHILLRNYPNPFNPSTIIYYEIGKKEKVEIKIYDILGREVRSLFTKEQGAGTFQINWDGRNDWNKPVAAGIYFCRLRTKDNFKVHKMILLDGGYGSTSISKSKLQKNHVPILPEANSVFNYSIIISGSNILHTEFNYLSCSGDTTLYLSVPKILQTVTIGPEGGEIEGNNFYISIPATAFDSEYRIILFEKPIDDWDKNAASKIWGIEGFPLYFNIPLEISIEPEIELTGESYITVGKEYEIPFMNSTELVYNFLESTDTLGYLTARFSSNPNYSTTQFAKDITSNYKQNKIFFSSQTGFYSKLSNNKHFKIFVNAKIPQGYYPATNSLGNLFEHNYDLVKEFGFDTVNINWPVDVYVKELKDNLYNRGCIYYPTFGMKNMSILIDQRRIEGITQSSIREYVIGVTRSYDQQFFLPNEFTGIVNPDRYWFHHAVGSWFEEKTFSQNNMWFFPIDYCHADYHWPGDGSGDNSTAPFLGMREGAGNNSKSALKHGGGMSTFIKYLDLNYGAAPILNVYQQIRESNYHPIQALKTILSDSYFWWPDYLGQLMNEDLYRFYKGRYFTYYEGNDENNIFGGEYDFTDKNDTLKIFDNIELTSLSAKAFYVGLNSPEIDRNRIIEISQSNNDNTLFVYGGTGTENYCLLRKGVNFLQDIEGLLNSKVDEEYIDHLVVIVTNAECEIPYTNKSFSSLKILLKKKQNISFNHCKIRIRVCATQEPSDTYWDPSWYTDGSFNDYIYTGIINQTLQGGNSTGSINVELDSYHNIISLSVMAYDNTYGTLEWGMTAGNLVPTADDNSRIEYKYYGNSVCNYVTSRYTKAIDPNGNSSEDTEYSCNDNSIFEITFSYW